MAIESVSWCSLVQFWLTVRCYPDFYILWPRYYWFETPDPGCVVNTQPRIWLYIKSWIYFKVSTLNLSWQKIQDFSWIICCYICYGLGLHFGSAKSLDIVMILVGHDVCESWMWYSHFCVSFYTEMLWWGLVTIWWHHALMNNIHVLIVDLQSSGENEFG